MKRNLIALLLSVLVFTGAACSESPDVKIGAILSITGTGAPYGSSIRNGVDLAVDEINGRGGITVDGGDTKPVTLLFRDTQSDPRVGVEASRELIEAGVLAVIGSDVSDVTLAMAPVFQEAGVVLLSPSSSSPRLSSAGDYIFRNFPSDELEALNTADYIFNKSGLREAAVIANQNEFGIGTKNAFIERFRQLGGRVTAQTTYPPDATDFSQQLADVTAANAPAIYIAGYSADTANVVKALREAGNSAALFGTGAVLPEEVVTIAGAAAEGLVFPHASFDLDDSSQVVQDFVTAYRGKYGSEPDTYAAHGYDAMHILAQAVQEVGMIKDEIRFYLNSMNPYPGVTGDTDFTETGDVRKFHDMLRIVEGRAIHATDVPAGG